jgi:hypothetical protein
VTPWSPDEGHEVLAYGGDEPPRRLPLAVPLGVGLACLVVGLLIGTRLDVGDATSSGAPPAAGDSDPDASDAPEVPPVAAGAITKLGPHEDSVFLLAVYNEGDEEVVATLAALPGWVPPVTRVVPTAVGPHSWAHVTFETRPDCGIYPGTVRSVRLQVRGEDGPADLIALLPQPAQALRDHHDATCDRTG